MEVGPSPLTLLTLMKIIFPSCRQMNLLPYLFFYLLSPIFGLLDSEPHRVARFNNILSENWSDCESGGYNEKIRKMTYIPIDKGHHADVYFFLLWCVGCSSRRKQWSTLLGIWPTSIGWQSTSTLLILQIKHDFCFRDVDKNFKHVMDANKTHKIFSTWSNTCYSTGASGS